jgi:hypothetical protein
MLPLAPKPRTRPSFQRHRKLNEVVTSPRDASKALAPGAINRCSSPVSRLISSSRCATASRAILYRRRYTNRRCRCKASHDSGLQELSAPRLHRAIPSDNRYSLEQVKSNRGYPTLKPLAVGFHSRKPGKTKNLRWLTASTESVIAGEPLDCSSRSDRRSLEHPGW